MAAEETEKHPPTAVLTKAIDILSCFGPKSGALSLSEIAKNTGLPVSTCHRIAHTLVAGGLLSRGSDRRFRVGTKLWTIAQHAPLSDRLREAALPSLARLYEETGENITLAVLDRGQALYVDRLVGERSVPTISRAGGHLPLHTTGVGKVLLAHHSESYIDQYLAQELERPTPYSIVDPVRLREELKEVRERGYSMTKEEMTIGSGSIAVPIMRGRRCIAAVGVIVHLARLNAPRLVATLTKAASSIAASMEMIHPVDDLDGVGPRTTQNSPGEKSPSPGGDSPQPTPRGAQKSP